MATQITIPEVGESVTSGVIAAWLKADGDYVERDEAVLELETDKVTMEVPAPAAGILSHSASEGDEVEVGATVGSIAEGEAPAKKDSGETGAGAGKGEQAAGKGEQKGKKAQEESRGGDGGGSGRSAAVAEAESKATPQRTSQPAAPAGPDAGEPNGALHATPLARKIAQEQGVDLSRVRATGAAGRIREQDVLAYLSSGAGSSGGGGAGVAQVAPAAAGQRSSRREKMSPLRQRVAQRLVEAQQTAAMLTTFNECDMTAVMALRKRFKEPFQEKHGVGLGFMSFFIKAACYALREVPKVNAAIVDDGGKAAIEYHDYCDIAIAVASPKGLVVPVLRSAERMSFAGIEATVKDFGSRAKEGKLTLDEMTGGTFTITNGGVFGSLNSTPILNPPQSGILGMHAIKNRPVEDPDHPGQIALRPMMYLALSYDHRVIDGAEAVTFLVKIKEAIEDPQRLMLEV